MAKKSAGILVYRNEKGMTEVFLVHPGGPFWQKKDQGAWSIPKGEFTTQEDALVAARREFQEETGQSIEGEFEPLTPVKQLGGKEVHAWAVEGNVDPSRLHSNSFSMEWPPRSGNMQRFPEVDRGAWFPFSVAEMKILKGQLDILKELEAKLQQKKS